MGGLQPRISNIIKAVLNGRPPLMSARHPAREYWSLEQLKSEIIRVTKVIHPVFEELKSDSALTRAVSGAVLYLKELKLDVMVLTMGRITTLSASERMKHMLMDSKAIANLELFANSYDGGSEGELDGWFNISSAGTLFKYVDHCFTAGGKRKLKCWMLKPLFDSNAIVARQNAITELVTSM